MPHDGFGHWLRSLLETRLGGRYPANNCIPVRALSTRTIDEGTYDTVR